MSRLRVAEERAEELVAAFRNRLGLVDRAPGFLDLQVWQSERDPGEIIMVSRWRNRGDFRSYMRSEEHRRSHERIPAGLKQAIKLERLDHMRGYELVAD